MADLRICFIGDSFTQGTGDDACLGWPGRVCASARARGHAVTVYNLGIRRETTDDIRGRWRAEVAPRLVAGVDGRIVFSFGANDATIEDGHWRVPPDLSAENARAMIARARLTYQVLVVGPPPAPEPDKTARHAELAARYAGGLPGPRRAVPRHPGADQVGGCLVGGGRGRRRHPSRCARVRGAGQPGGRLAGLAGVAPVAILATPRTDRRSGASREWLLAGVQARAIGRPAEPVAPLMRNGAKT